MATSDEICANGDCEEHYHAHDTIFTAGETQQQSQVQLLPQRTPTSEGHLTESTNDSKSVTENTLREQESVPTYDPADHGFRRIIRNFTLSYELLYPIPPTPAD